MPRRSTDLQGGGQVQITPLIPPEGVAKGCLPRTSRIGQDCPLAAERLPYVIPQEEWAGIIPNADLRPLVPFGLYQDGVGSCASESCGQAIQIKIVQAGFAPVKLNPWTQYRTVSGGVDRGSTLGDNLKHARDVGICSYDFWPRYDDTTWDDPDGPRIIHPWYSTPEGDWEGNARNFRIDEFWECTTVAEVGTCLILGHPVSFGWQGHSCVLTKLVSTTSAEYRNSWGDGWGDMGFGIVSLSAIDIRYGAYAVRSVIVPSQEVLPPDPQKRQAA